MAVLRSKSNLTKEENFTNILYNLLEIQGDKCYARRGFNKKLKGYGVKQSEFSNFKDKGHPTSERKFREYKEELIHRGFIEEFYTKNKQAGRPYYTITPIGVVYLVKYSDSITGSAITNIIKFLDKFIDKSDPIELGKPFWDFFNEIQIIQAIKQIAHFTEIVLGVEDTVVKFDLFNMKSKNRICLFMSRHSDNKFTIAKSPLQETMKSKKRGESKAYSKEDYYQDIALQFITTMFYYLLINIKEKEFMKNCPKKVLLISEMIRLTIESELQEDRKNILESWIALTH